MSFLDIWFVQEYKQLFIADNAEVHSNPLLPNLNTIAPCSHEEADSRMLIHVLHVARNGHQIIMIKTVVLML